MIPADYSILQMVREAWFWAAIFRDHGTFILNSLAPNERTAAEKAAEFQRRFGVLAEEAEALARSMGVTAPAGATGPVAPSLPPPPERYQGAELLQYQQAVRTLVVRLTDQIRSLREFKEELLQKRLDGTINLNLGPSLLQHMIDEAEEGYRALSGAREAANLPVPLALLHHHLFWLPDSAGHAAALHGGLDGAEHELLERTDRFKSELEALGGKARELYAMLRSRPRTAGPLRRLTREALAEVGDFERFLADLKAQLEAHEILTYLSPLFADHMLREERYYQEKVQSLKEQE